MTDLSDLKFHPLADIFPLMEGEEFDALVADIKKNALRYRITLHEDMILEGRNRYRAMKKAGHTPNKGHFQKYKPAVPSDTPLSYVVTANLCRRHLTAEQKRDVLVKIIAAQPEKSDRQIGKQTGVDHKTVAKARKRGEATGEVSPVDKRKGADGRTRKQPKKKATKPRISKAERENNASLEAMESRWRAMWKAEGRSLADYDAGIHDQNSEVWKWRRAKGQAAIAAENAAWLRDHPGNPLPEHLCGLSEAEGAEYDAWSKNYYADAARSREGEKPSYRELEIKCTALESEIEERKAPVTRDALIDALVEWVIPMPTKERKDELDMLVVAVLKQAKGRHRPNPIIDSLGRKWKFDFFKGNFGHDTWSVNLVNGDQELKSERPMQRQPDEAYAEACKAIEAECKKKAA